jgi:hypothetical protein
MKEGLLPKGNEMSSNAYREMLEKLPQLTRREKLKLIEEIFTGLQREIEKPPFRDIMEYKGFAKEAWESVDAQEYVDEERNSWD